MKNILCYGDSNTWGWIPGKPDCRHPYKKRWTGILQKKLGEDYRVIEAGLNGRTTVFEDPVNPEQERQGNPELYAGNAAPVRPCRCHARYQ